MNETDHFQVQISWSFPVPFWLTFAVARAHPIVIDPDPLSGWRLLEDCRARLETSAAGFALPPSCAAARLLEVHVDDARFLQDPPSSRRTGDCTQHLVEPF